MRYTNQRFTYLLNISVGIDLKELGVRCRNVWNFAQGLKSKADLHSKMSVCTGGQPSPTHWQFQPCTIWCALLAFSLVQFSLFKQFNSPRGNVSESPAWKDESWALLETDCDRWMGSESEAAVSSRQMELRWKRALDAVQSQCSNFELYRLKHWQPMVDGTSVAGKV